MIHRQRPAFALASALLGLSCALAASCGRGATGKPGTADSSSPAPARVGGARPGGGGQPAIASTGQPPVPAPGPGQPAAPQGQPGQPGPPSEGQPKIPPPISVVDKMIVAKVNGREIMGKDLNRAYVSSWRQFLQGGVALPIDMQKKVMTELLEAMIGSELLRQQAIAEGIKPDDKAIDAQYRKIQSGASSEEQFKQALQQHGMTSEKLREEITSNYLTDTFVRKFAAAHARELSTTEAEAKAFYDKNPQTFTRQEMVHARHILRKFPPNATDKQKQAERAKIEEAQAKLKAGEDFAKVASAYSSDVTAAKGGDLGFFPRGKMVPQFEEAAFTLNPGQSSGIVETRFGYHIIRCEEKVKPGLIPFAEVKSQIVQKLSEDKKQKELNQYVDKLRAKAKVEVLLNLPEEETGKPGEAKAPAAAPAG